MDEQIASFLQAAVARGSHEDPAIVGAESGSAPLDTPISGSADGGNRTRTLSLGSDGSDPAGALDPLVSSDSGFEGDARECP